MFFSIPHTIELNDDDGSVYTAFEIHLNGAVHSAVRYSQLHKLNEHIQKRFDAFNLSEFPPKKLFSLSVAEKEERRMVLEAYIQSIGQQPEIAKSNIFVDFLLQSQKEYNKLNEEESVKLTVYTADWKPICVDIMGSDYSPEVLRYTAASLGIEAKLHPFFSLYLMAGGEKQKSIVRRLQDMECPYLTLKALDDNHTIEIRRSYWSKDFDERLMKNNVTLHLLYIECIRNLEDRWMKPSAETLRKLKQLKTAGLKEQFVKVVKSEHMYGYKMLSLGTVDYPEEGSETPVTVYAGCENIRLMYRDGKTISLPVTRIKCWKLFPDKKNVIALEFLVMKDTLKWIHITTTKTDVILISMMLQAVLDEKIQLREGKELELTKVREYSGYLPISNKDRKEKQGMRPKAPSFSSLNNRDNALFMDEISDNDL